MKGSWTCWHSCNMPEYCRGVESGILITKKNGIALVVVLLAHHSGVGLQRINGSLFTVSNRFDTTIVEAEGCLLESKYLT